MAGFVNTVNGQPGRYRSSSITLANGQGAALPLDASGNLITSSGSGASASQVQGNVASGATDAGNPVKVGAVFNTTRPTVTDGQRVDLQATNRGLLIASLLSENTIAAAVPTSIIQVGGVDASGQSQNFRLADTGDGVTTKLLAASQYVYNGTNSDRRRSVINTMNSTGTGIAAAGMVAQLDDTAPTSVTENQFGPVRMSVNRALMVEQVFTYGRATADTQIKATAGFVHTVSVAPTGTVTAGVLTVYDSAAESGTVIFSVSLPITSFSPFTIILNVNAATGIYVGFDATLANVQATVSYR